MKRIFIYSFLFAAFSFCSKTGFAQNKIPDPRYEIDSLLTVINTADENDNKASMCIRLAILYKNVGEYDKGIQSAEQAAFIAKKMGVKNREAQAYNMIGVINKDLGNYQEAYKSYEKVLIILEETGNKMGLASTYNNLANLHANQGKLSEAISEYTAALKIFQDIGQKAGAGICYNNIGEIYIEQSNYAEALKALFLAYDLFCEAGYTPGKAAVYSNIGDIYRYQGNYSEALKYHFESLKFSEEIKDEPGSSGAYRSIGNIFMDQSNYTDALKYYFTSLKIVEKIRDKLGTADILNNIGTVYTKQAKYDEALKTHLEALKLQQELENKAGIAKSLNNIGLIYKEEGKYNEALKNLLASLKVSEELGDKNATADIYNNIGLVFSGQASKLKVSDAKEKYLEALKFLNKGLLLAKEIGAKSLVRDSYAGLADVYASLLTYNKAYELSKLYIEINDTLLNDVTSKKMERLRLQYEIEKAQLDEKSHQEKIQSEMQFAFSKREDSLKYQQNLTGEQLKQQTLLTIRQEQALLLKQASLDLNNKENEINQLAYLKTQAELGAEQSQRQEKEKQLTIAEQEKALQAGQLELQQTELALKENQLQAQRKQRYFYIGGLALMLLLFIFIYSNIKSRQKANSMIAAERLKVEKAESGHKMAELELQSLRTQLNPHFMFNSLNAIQELILMEDNDNSHIYLSRFSELLRMLLDNANQPFVPLRKEIMLLELYLSLEKLRIPDLEYSFTIDPEIDSEKTMIPNMILQPYIENAIWHGLSHKKENKKLSIRVTRDNEILHFEIEDNGVGRKKAHEMKSLYRKEHKSKGMELLSKRFSLLSKEYSMDIESRITDLTKNGDNDSGTLVEITVPVNLTEKYNQAIYDQGYNN